MPDEFLIMGAGYFGKLPARADFIIGACPAGFLRVWEPFLMAGMAGSRSDLGQSWTDAYMTMPVWRFHLVPTMPDCQLKTSVVGAFMPCVDRVGREFPLTIAAPVTSCTNSDMDLENWLDRVEDILLSTLHEGADLPDFVSAVAGLVDPSCAGPAVDEKKAVSLPPSAASQGQIASVFWCQPGDNHFAFHCHGLPEGPAFRWLMLPETCAPDGHADPETGRFDDRYLPEDHRT